MNVSSFARQFGLHSKNLNRSIPLGGRGGFTKFNQRGGGHGHEDHGHHQQGPGEVITQPIYLVFFINDHT
jgi:hypothetical protein